MEKDENGETMVETIKDLVVTSAYRYTKVRTISLMGHVTFFRLELKVTKTLAFINKNLITGGKKQSSCKRCCYILVSLITDMYDCDV